MNKAMSAVFSMLLLQQFSVCASKPTNPSAVSDTQKNQSAEAAQQDYERGMQALESKDYTQASTLFQSAAKEGHAAAQAELARFLETGKGVQRDEVQAAYWYQQAASQGNTYAQQHLGYFYDAGRGGLQQDKKLADYWYRLVGLNQISSQVSESPDVKNEKTSEFGSKQKIKLNQLAQKGTKMFQAGKYTEAEYLLKESLAILEKSSDKDHPEVAILLMAIASVYLAQNDYARAEPLYQRSLKIFEKAFGLEHPKVADVLTDLAILYQAQADYAKAEPLYQRSLKILENTYGQDHPEIAIVLNNLGELYLTQADYAKAESMFQHSLKIAEKAKGHEQSVLVRILDNLGEFYRLQADYIKAEPFFHRSLKIAEKAYGLEHPKVADVLTNLANLYREQAKYTKAEHLYQRSLKIVEKAYGLDHPETANVLINLAMLYHVQEKYAKADPLYQRNLKIYENAYGLEHPTVASILSNLASLYKEQAEYEKAETLYQRSLKIVEKVYGPGHPNVAKILTNLASIYNSQANYVESERLLKQSLKIVEKAYGLEHPAFASVLFNLAELYQNQADYNKAELLYQRSLKINEKIYGLDNPHIANDLNKLAEIYLFLADYDRAMPLLERSFKIAIKASGKESLNIARVLLQLSRILQFFAKYAEAELLLQRSLKITEKIFGLEHPEVAVILNNLADLYKAQANYTKAESFYHRSLKIIEKAYGLEHPDVAVILNNLADIYLKTADFTKAESLYQRSLKIAEKAYGPVHPFEAIFLDNIALLYEAQGQNTRAGVTFNKSLRLMNQLLDRWLWAADEHTRQTFIKKEEQRRNIYLSYYTKHNTPEEALYFSLSRKALLLRIESEFKNLARHHPDPALQQQLDKFYKLANQIATLSFSDKGNAELIKKLETQRANLEQDLFQQVSSFKSNTTEVKPSQVLEKLRPEQSLVDFHVFKTYDFKTDKSLSEQVIALIANQQHGIQLVKLGEFAPIGAAITEYRKALLEKRQIEPIAQDLYRMLWEKLLPYLGATKTLFLVPDGSLHLLPFKALQTQDGNYLGEQQQLITLSSARDIVLPPGAVDSRSPSAIFADPDFGEVAPKTATISANQLNIKNGAQQAIPFKPLKATLEEGQAIASLLNQKHPQIPARLFLQRDASEDQLNAVKSPQILHLATHGYYQEDRRLEDDLPGSRGLMMRSEPGLNLGPVENPLVRSFLALSGANSSLMGHKPLNATDSTDGLITALEVLNLNLEGTQLVTLSACETGLGEVRKGEGVYSLNRAFQEAGAKAVLSTLWKVNDNATSLFMQKFYKRFLNGTPSQLALQETQAEFIHDASYHDPYYWAGFVMTGIE
ncbi:MAG: tetratricopeptide repeat protein [Methylococcales bacterium]